jgi:hypothetical protein
LCQPPTEGIDVDVIREDLLTVDLNDGDQLAVALLELLIRGDVDLIEFELELGAQPLERRPCPVAEAAAGSAVEDDPAYG